MGIDIIRHTLGISVMFPILIIRCTIEDLMQNILNQNLQQYLNDKFNILNKTGTRNVALE